MKNRGAHNYSIATTLIDQLILAGIEDIVVSPGFRNSPLILAAQRDSRICTHTVLDERSAAFFALGLAKGKKKPAALACTSGTAAGNYFPAILEAAHSQTSLVVITADRPSELLGLGANQTMDQKSLFGVHARESVTIATLSIDNFNFDWLRYVVGKTVLACEFPNPGPVHINIAFSEPLLPLATSEISQPLGKEKKFITPKPLFDQSIFSEILRDEEETMIVLGNADFSNEALNAFLFAAEKMGAILLAEPSTGILARPLSLNCKTLINRFDGLLESKIFQKEVWRVLRFGPPPVHKKLPDFLAGLEKAKHFLFDFVNEARDPSLSQATYFSGEPNAWALALKRHLIEAPSRNPSSVALQLKLQSNISTHAPKEVISKSESLDEANYMQLLLRNIPDGAALFLGNSLPIRNFNSCRETPVRYSQVFHNRGLSGIDGLIASAAGVAQSISGKLILILGDLSAQHDIGSLASIANLEGNACLKIIIVNNNGGGIFRTLPLPQDQIEWFTTPQKIDFSKAAAAFGISYDSCSSILDADKLLQNFFSAPSSGVFEFFLKSDA
jgi:2-succinyl-5-enolpyruvyl-6-hydroxy-3-cyclohexene-1-carboxylate synthase